MDVHATLSISCSRAGKRKISTNQIKRLRIVLHDQIAQYWQECTEKSAFGNSILDIHLASFSFRVRYLLVYFYTSLNLRVSNKE